MRVSKLFVYLRSLQSAGLWKLAKNMGFGHPYSCKLHKTIQPAASITFIGLFCDQLVTQGVFWRDLHVVWVSFWVSFCSGSIFASKGRVRLNE